MIYDFDLTNDFVFRHIFGDERNADILLAFINAVLKSKNIEPVRSVYPMNPHIDTKEIAQKEGILDVRAVDNNGNQYDIEIQVRPHTGYIKRTLYYLARMYGGQLKRGMEFHALKPCIGISILDYNLFPQSTLYHHLFLLKSVDEKDFELTRDIALHYLELPKLNKPAHNDTHMLGKWLYLLQNIKDTEDSMVQKITNEFPELDRVKKEYSTMMTDEQLRAEALAHEMWVMDQMAYTRDARNEGIEEGITHTKNELAKKMKAKGLSPHDISEITGLSLAEIENID